MDREFISFKYRRIPETIIQIMDIIDGNTRIYGLTLEKKWC
jgi:hypothetical protein